MEGAPGNLTAVKKLGTTSSFSMAAVGVITFTVAILTPPLSGPLSTG